jgi:hypothetical protein
MRRSLFNCWSRAKAYSAYMCDVSTKPDAPEDPNLMQIVPALIATALVICLIVALFA